LLCPSAMGHRCATHARLMGVALTASVLHWGEIGWENL